MPTPTDTTPTSDAAKPLETRYRSHVPITFRRPRVSNSYYSPGDLIAGRGPAPKDPECKQRPNARKDLEAVPDAFAGMPEAPAHPCRV